MIMATIIKRTDSLTELPLTTASRRSLPPRGSREQRQSKAFPPPRGSLN